jgi:putative ABC transport system permease protein
MSSATRSVTLSDLGPGTHTVQAGDYSVTLSVVPWFADDPDIVELVVKYGGTSYVSSSSSLPIYQAAKISEGNVAVALFSIGTVSALVSALAIVAVSAKEVHEGRRTLGVLKTVGASAGAIRRLVFPQALLLGLAGGAIGVLLGIAAVTALSSYGALMVFGHELEVMVDFRVALFSLLGAVLISMVSALASAELAARETTIGAIRRLPPETPEQVDVDEMLRE